MTSAEIRSALAGTAALWLPLAVAVILTLARPRVSPDRAARRRAAALLLLAIAGQCLHFAEELATGFHQRFPPLLGLAPWPAAFFATFNLAWIAIWALAALGLRAGLVAALVPAWFLALALLLNGVAHPLLALRTGGYFPGFWTSPLVGLLGIVLGRSLLALTGPRGDHEPA